MLFNFPCPNCGEEIEVDTFEPVCLCPLCYAMSGMCQCDTCVIEHCDKKCLRENK